MPTNLRNTQTHIEWVGTADPNLRSTLTHVEVIASYVPLLRSTQTHVEWVGTINPPIRVTQYQLEVIVRLADEELDVDYLHTDVQFPQPQFVPVEYGERWGHNS